MATKATVTPSVSEISNEVANNATSSVNYEATKAIEKAYKEARTKYVSLRDLNEKILTAKWDGQPLVEDKIYHMAMLAGITLLVIKANRRTMKRAVKMLLGCKAVGMTTPAIVVKASLMQAWGMTLLDPLTEKFATDEQIAEGYVVLEGNGRLHGWLVASVLEGQAPFDFKFVFNNYSSPEEAGNAYLGTNEYMTRTTNKDRMGIAAARCTDPLILSFNRLTEEDGVIPKAAYFWTYGRELQASEANKLTAGEADAPTFDPTVIEALKKVYAVFKAKFGCRGAESIYRGVPAAKWAANLLKDSATASALADKICGKVDNIGLDIYAALITAKSDAKKHLTREQVIQSTLDKMMND